MALLSAARPDFKATDAFAVVRAVPSERF